MPRKFSNPPKSPRRDAEPADYLSFFARQTLASFSLPEVREGHVVPRKKALELHRDHADSDAITWLGHAAFLIRAAGKTILIDPYLSRTAGPGPFGPNRYARAAIGLADIHPIDAVLLTHNHYDHFDVTTLRRLAENKNIHVTVPAALGTAVQRIGFNSVDELHWNDTVNIGDLSITATPAIHWSKRGLLDENTTHWCGYMLEWGDRRVYFAGDTGYGPVFREMGDQWGSIDLGIVGIGAYEPQVIMKPVHTSPEEAVQLGRDMNCQRLLGMHWGTIVLSEEDPWEPPVRFQAAAQNAQYAPEDAWIMRLGETRSLQF